MRKNLRLTKKNLLLQERLAFLERDTFRRKHLSFRNHSFAEREENMFCLFRKQAKILAKSQPYHHL